MLSVLTLSDIAAVIRRAHEEGAHVALVQTHDARTANVLDRLLANGVETKALEVVTLGEGLPGTPYKATLPVAVQHLVEARDARLVVFADLVDGWGNEAFGVLYAGQPVASVKDVTDSLADGDALDVRHGELWIESPAGSGVWSFAGVVLHDVAVELRKHGVLVAG